MNIMPSLVQLGVAVPISVSTNDSTIIARVAELIKTPLSLFDIDDLRFMIVQGDYLDYLMPLAIDKLRNDPLCEALYYDGDLLKSALLVGDIYWKENPAMRKEMEPIAKEALGDVRLNELPKEIADQVRQAISSFLRP